MRVEGAGASPGSRPWPDSAHGRLGGDGSWRPADWRIITPFAKSDAPVCSLLTLAEVRALANPNKNGAAWWLEVRDDSKDEFREAWHRLVPYPPSGPSHGG